MSDVTFTHIQCPLCESDVSCDKLGSHLFHEHAEEDLQLPQVIKAQHAALMLALQESRGFPSQQAQFLRAIRALEAS